MPTPGAAIAVGRSAVTTVKSVFAKDKTGDRRREAATAADAVRRGDRQALELLRYRAFQGGSAEPQIFRDTLTQLATAGVLTGAPNYEFRGATGGEPAPLPAGMRRLPWWIWALLVAAAVIAVVPGVRRRLFG